MSALHIEVATSKVSASPVDMNTASPLVNSETYAAERKQDDFNQLRQAAMERANQSSRVPVIVLPGATGKLSLVTLITYIAGRGTQPCHTMYGLRCCAAVEACNSAIGNHKDDNADNSKDVIVREASKLSRDTRKNIVERALATKDQDQYRFLKLIKDRMDA